MSIVNNKFTIHNLFFWQKIHFVKKTLHLFGPEMCLSFTFSQLLMDFICIFVSILPASPHTHTPLCRAQKCSETGYIGVLQIQYVVAHCSAFPLVHAVT